MKSNLQHKLNLYFQAKPEQKPATNQEATPTSQLQLIEHEIFEHPLKKSCTFDLDHLLLGPDRHYKSEELLFLDVECIELGFGVNNTPYLIGLAYFDQGQLKVKQVFSPDPLVEEEALAFLDEFWHQFNYIVTYNGKSFDIPLIKSRFDLFRLENPHDFTEHFDLYHIIRRVYEFDRYRLIDSERNLLDLRRENDLPGAYSGQAYFEYLKHQNETLLEKIKAHNLYDLVSLAALTERLATDLEAAGDDSSYLAPRKLYKYDASYHNVKFLRQHFAKRSDLDGEDFFYLAHAYKKQKDHRRAARYYRRAYRGGYKKALKPWLVTLYYHLKNPQKAADLIEELLPIEEMRYQEQMLAIRDKLKM